MSFDYRGFIPLQHKIASLESQLKQKDAEIAELKSALGDGLLEISKTKGKKIYTLNNRIAELEFALSVKETSANELGAENISLNTQRIKLETRISDLLVIKEKSEERIKELEAMNHALVGDTVGLKVELSKKDACIAELEVEVKRLQGDLDANSQ